MFQPKYTMQGYDWPEQRSLDEIGFVRAIRTLLTSHLPVLLPSLHRTVVRELDCQLWESRRRDGRLLGMH